MAKRFVKNSGQSINDGFLGILPGLKTTHPSFPFWQLVRGGVEEMFEESEREWLRSGRGVSLA